MNVLVLEKGSKSDYNKSEGLAKTIYWYKYQFKKKSKKCFKKNLGERM